jgi:hypothetical protein
MAAGNVRTGSGYMVFMLRMWLDSPAPGGGENGWRFDLEDPASRNRRGFASLEELSEFLRGLPVQVREEAHGGRGPETKSDEGSGRRAKDPKKGS